MKTIFILSLILLLSSCHQNRDEESAVSSNVSHEVELDSTDLSQEFSTHYEVYGKDIPILIINGGPGMNSLGFRPLAKEIGKFSRAIIYDQRGTGLSKLDKIDSSTVNLDLMVKDIEELRSRLKIDKWIVLGHSFGGMLASYYATKYPDNIIGLILSSSGGINLDLFNGPSITSSLSDEMQDSLRIYREMRANGDSSHQTHLKLTRILAPLYVVDSNHYETIAERLTQGNMALNGLIWSEMRNMNFDCSEKLQKFKQPCLIIQGKNDVLPISIAQKTDSILPNSELVLLPNCAHYGWLDQEDLYFGHIKSFVQKFNETKE